METREHWERLYRSRSSNHHSWHQDHLRRSLELIAEARLAKDARLVDVGGGDSTLADDLLKEGYVNLTVLDISEAGLNQAKERLGSLASHVRWIQADIAEAQFQRDEFDLWHDRALFHFLTATQSREAYLALLRGSLRPGGYAVIATFAENGPEECSGLGMQRYSELELATELGPEFRVLEGREERHQKPSGGEQQFIYCLFHKA